MIVGALLLIVGAVLMAAELAVAFGEGQWWLMAVFLLTAFTEYVVFTEWWGDVRP